MPIHLLDSNILLRAANKTAPEYGIVAAAITSLAARGDDLCLVPQVVVEFWSVATRPADVNGYGWEPAQAEAEVREALDRFPLLDDIPAIFDHWLRLVIAHGVRGKKVHDARLVAAMQTHGIANILTFNVADFGRYDGITAVHPSSV
jgi:predicted nucleic acid-binding protein